MGDSLTNPAGWMKTVLGLDLDGYGRPPATGDAASGAAPMSDGDPASGDAASLTISVSSNNDGTFTVTGSGFTATDTAHVWVANDLMQHIPLGDPPANGGNFTYTTGNICMQPGGKRHLHANDGSPNVRPDFTGTHWSNLVTIECDPNWAVQPDDPDDPSDPSDPSDPDPAPADPAPSTPDPAPSNSDGNAQPGEEEGGPDKS